TAAAQVHGDARGRRDRPLEAGGGTFAAVALPTGVEHDGGPTLPRLLLPADHELAGAGGRAPVHPTQVVAVAVLAGGDVVLTVHGDRARAAVPAADEVAGEPDVRQRHDRGYDGQLADGGEGAAELAQAERVGQPDHQRADLVPAPHLGPDG